VIVPDPAATVMLLRPAAGGFEVLMVERNARGFFGSIVVFPGGAVDAIDRVGEGGDERAARRAAVRELAEEAGILLTSAGAVAGPVVRDEAYYRWVETNAVEMAVDSLVLVSRWVTPEGAPRRFDTRFYMASSEDVPEVRIDSEELVGHSWVSPDTALERHESGEWPMILPTLAHIRWLQRRSSIEDAIRSARGADGRTLIQPRRMDDGSLLPIHLPAEVE
jgi:8-oxo-dGTP pyrophosphatase MutT (NUDIX family)